MRAPAPAETTAMTLSHYLSILSVRRKSIAAVLLAAVILVMGITMMLPKTYTASATLLIDVKLNDPLGGVALGQALLPETLQAYMKTQAEIIAGERSARSVVAALKLNESTSFREKWQASGVADSVRYEDWLIETLRKRLDVGPSRDSTVITVTFSDSDRATAAQVANAFSRAYLETDLALKVEPAQRSASFFDERTKAVREKLERAQARLSEFQRRRGMVANDEKLDIENARLADLSSQLTVLQSAAAEAEFKQRQSTSIQEVQNSPNVQALRGELSKAEARMSEVAAQFGPNHPQFQRQDEEVKALRQKLAVEMQQAANTVGASSRVSRQREEQVRAAYEAQRAKVVSMRAARDEAGLLLHDVDNAKKEYDAVLQRFGQTSLESKVTQTNATILNNATVPLYPSSPKVFLNLVLAIFLGVMGGVAFAVAREATDRRVRGTNDIVEVLNLPVLGVLESTSGNNAARDQRGTAPAGPYYLPKPRT